MATASMACGFEASVARNVLEIGGEVSLPYLRQLTICVGR